MKRSLAIWRVVVAALFAWLAVPLAANAQGLLGKRLALVIGNSGYQSVYSLKNAVNDATAVAGALEVLGFDVTLLTDAGRDEIDAAIETMANRAIAEGAQATLLYYSGHGFQMRGANYIVPVDAVLDNRDKIDDQTIRLDRIIARLESNDRQTIILLDACRDNPLPPSVREADARNGLAEVRTGVNTYIAFATAPGGVSMDGKGNQGPFAEAFVRSVSLPDVSVSDMMSVVRTSVRAQTKGMQLPWENNTLFSPFYFNPGTYDPQQAAVLLPPPPKPPVQPAIPGTEEKPVTVAANDSPPVTPTIATPVQTSGVVQPNVVSPRPFGEGSVTSVTPGTTIVVPSATQPSVAAASQEVADIGPESRSIVEPQTTPVAATPQLQPGQAASGGDATQVANINPSVPRLAPLDQPAAVIVGEEVLPGGDESSVPVTPIPEQSVDLALAVQEELKRVGCYTGALDGDWGRRSRDALQKFIAEVKEASLEVTEPTAEVLAILKSKDAVVCKRTVVATPEPPRKPQTQTQTRTQTAQPPKKPAQAQPAPPAETAIQPGKIKVGIGSGVFR